MSVGQIALDYFLLFSFMTFVVKFPSLAGLCFILKAFFVYFQFLLYSRNTIKSVDSKQQKPNHIV
jgi:hypothetical protein